MDYRSNVSIPLKHSQYSYTHYSYILYIIIYKDISRKYTYTVYSMENSFYFPAVELYLVNICVKYSHKPRF